MLKYILNGGVSQHPVFFTKEKFYSIKEDLDKVEWRKGYQPAGTYYGNRMQAFPCYEYPYEKENETIKKKLEDILQTNIIEFHCLARKTILSEVKQSTQNFGKYGLVHKDDNENQSPIIAGMMYFDQSFDGGTAFFKDQMEKVPDMYISAFPNRLVLYHGGRWHAPCLDYTFEERLTLSFFAKVKR